MFDNRNLRLDLLALFLLAVVLFLGVSLATYDRADPVSQIAQPLAGLYTPDVLVFPQNESIQNACGRWGCLAADLLFHGLGIGAFYLLISLAVLDYLLLRRRPIDAPLVRLAGWIASLVGLAALSALLVPGWSPGPLIGAGGYLGALLRTALEQHFATLGSMILCVSLVAGGLLLCTDYALLHFAGNVCRGTWHLAHAGPLGWRRGSKSADGRNARKLSGFEDSDQTEEEEEQDEQPLSVRIRGRHLAASAVEAENDEEWEEVDSAEDGDDVADEDVEEEEEEEEEVEEEAEAEQQVVAVQPPKSARGPKAGRKVRTDEQHQEAGLHPGRRGAKTDETEDVRHSLDEAARVQETQPYELPSTELLIPGDEVCYESQAKEVRRKAKILEQTFADFGFQVKVVEIETGPVIAQFEVQLEAGLRLSKITGLADDLAIALRVPSVRIVAPIPGKNTVGIEVPNSERQVVRLREVIEESESKWNKMRIPLFLGKDVSGNSLTVDLSTLPHLLIAGRTGTGKSVCLNAIISSMLMTRRPDEVRLLLIDPKMVELSCYGRLPHLMHPVVTDMRKAEAILAWAVDKMEERYALLARAGVRHISSYNQLSEAELMKRLKPENDEQRREIPRQLPFIVIVADEMADLMMTAGKEVEQHIIRLAQKSRAVGIHLILATQKPTVDVITGLIKSNLPARISFQVASRTDSRVVLDEMGADKLLGNGDMLFLWPGTSTLLRGQGTYLSDDEIERIVDSVSTGEQDFVHELMNMKVVENTDDDPDRFKNRDELYEQAIDVLVREGRGSVSLLQRALGIGYGRAARLIDFMEEDGIVGSYNGSQAREVVISLEDWERMQRGQSAARESATATVPALPPPQRSRPATPSPQASDVARNAAKAARTFRPEEDEVDDRLDQEADEDAWDEEDSYDDEIEDTDDESYSEDEGDEAEFDDAAEVEEVEEEEEEEEEVEEVEEELSDEELDDESDWDEEEADEEEEADDADDIDEELADEGDVEEAEAEEELGEEEDDDEAPQAPARRRRNKTSGAGSKAGDRDGNSPRDNAKNPPVRVLRRGRGRRYA